MEQMQIPSNLDVLFVSSEQQDSRAFIQEAVTKFAETHTGYPDIIMMEMWRRMTTLCADDWHGFKHGPIHIPLISPHEAAESFRGYAVPYNTAVCIRRSPMPVEMVIPTDTIEVSHDVPTK
jgi:hypothetical protein